MEPQFAKYASHPIPDGNDVNKNAEFQLLLTRSRDLAQKLKLYTKRLINTRLGIIAGDQHGEDGNTKKFEEDTTQDLLSLEEEDFPVVCTFNHFLRLLENLVRYFIIISVVYLLGILWFILETCLFLRGIYSS